MSSPSCLMDSPEGVMFCDSCGEELRRRPVGNGRLKPKTCVSCGRAMDRAVYFTICPHCGFNYRIEISRIESKEGLTFRSLMPSFLVSATFVCAMLILLLLM